MDTEADAELCKLVDGCGDALAEGDSCADEDSKADGVTETDCVTDADADSEGSAEALKLALGDAEEDVRLTVTAADTVGMSLASVVTLLVWEKLVDRDGDCDGEPEADAEVVGDDSAERERSPLAVSDADTLTDGDNEALVVLERDGDCDGETVADAESDSDDSAERVKLPQDVADGDTLTDGDIVLLVEPERDGEGDGESEVDADTVSDGFPVLEAALLADGINDAESSIELDAAAVRVGSVVERADTTLLTDTPADAERLEEHGAERDAERQPDDDSLPEVHAVTLADAHGDDDGDAVDDCVATCDDGADDTEPERQPDDDSLLLT